ncbi:unnamed protein product [Tuber melanosporum]|uniref:(Perigord truffle) hypothetical protein n=1 Tax=Tuber melanosporum (strain Mel28) TaxID=656061 RepID=D5GCH9_TUBMM|nr:uncharacterized protein GSTUM_00005898001 [Tuber melanosporum]CAZ82222.1 unnamed protein product [Tuber melanosporum]
MILLPRPLSHLASPVGARKERGRDKYLVMDTSQLLNLPTEILVNILKFSASSTSPPPYKTLLNVALTCSALHHAVFCTENDLLWREPALALGIPESLRLDHVLYPGSSTLQKRLWRNVVKLNLAWGRPFPAKTPVIPKQQRAARQLPPVDKKGDWFGRRVVEVFVAGEGAKRENSYVTKPASVRDDGCAVFQVRPPGGPNGGIIPGLTYSLSGGPKVTCVLDPVMGKPREVILGNNRSHGWVASPLPLLTECVTPFPVQAGFVFEERSGEYRVRAVDASTAALSHSWNLGKRRPDRVVANGEILVAVTYAHPDSDGKTSQIPSNLVCVESFGGQEGRSRWKARTLAGSRIVWEFDLSIRWPQEMNRYTSFPHLKNFHITRTHLVCLVTQHPTATLGKLVGTDFYILDLETGGTVKRMKFSTKSPSTLPGSPRAAFTTALSHEFLLTDTYIVSGGAGGGLLVWNYVSDGHEPIYTIPDPLASDTTKPNGTASSLPRQCSALTMSGDGRYVAATTSDQLWLFDMVDKKVHAIYGNGRKIEARDYYARNPADDFPAGVWCWWKEWRSKRDQSGAMTWEEVDGSGGVAYLTGLDGEKRKLNVGKLLFDIAIGPHWAYLAFAMSFGMYSYVILMILWEKGLKGFEITGAG